MKPKITHIRSEDANFQYLETIQRNRAKRHQLKQFIFEGVRPVTQALQYGWDIRLLAYSREKRLSDWAEGILNSCPAPQHYELPIDLLHKISQKDEPSEILAVAAMAEDCLERIPEKDPLLVLVLDRPGNPGNLGTIIRTCDALGGSGIVVTGHAADLYDPETIRATTGSFFAVPVVRQPSHKELLPWFEALRQRHHGLQIVGTSAKAQKPIHALDLTGPVILLIGNENHGLSQAYRELCDAMVTIPMAGGSASSLNAASAASIMLYEVSRQRHQSG